MSIDRLDDRWLADLGSDDDERVIAALHRACPCSGSGRLYEAFMPLLQSFKKDQRLRVRDVALHLERDALEHLVKDDEKANDFIRNKPGGNGRRQERRRAGIRQGF